MKQQLNKKALNEALYQSDKEISVMASEIVKILGISASPRVAGGVSHSDSMLMELLNQIHIFGGKADRIVLAKKKIASCEGCYSVKSSECVFPCIHTDDTNEVLTEIANADAIVLATPVYWGSASSLLHILIEKMTALENNRWKIMDEIGRDPLEGKPFAILASQLMEGATQAMSQISTALVQMGMLLIPYGLIFKHSLLSNRGVRLGLRVIGERRFAHTEIDLRLAARNLVGLSMLFKSANYRFDDGVLREKDW